MAWRLGRIQPPYRWLLSLAWALTAAAALSLAVRGYAQLGNRYENFPTYYAAAKLIESGESPVRFYDDNWFRQRTERQSEIYNANTPLMAFFFLPLAGLSFGSARLAASIANLAALIAAACLMANALRMSGVYRAAAFFAVFAASTTMDNLGSAQVYPLVLLVLVLAWLSWRRDAGVTMGVLVGAAAAFKTAGLGLVALMLFERRWRAILGFAGILAILVAVTFPAVTGEGWLAYFRYASEMAGNPIVSQYWSVPGLVRNLFIYDERWNPRPLLDSPALARSIESLTLLVAAIFSARIALAARDRDATFGLFSILPLIFMPLTWRTHLCLAFLPAFIVFSRLEGRLASRLGAWFILGSMLAFAPGVERIHGLAEYLGPLFLFPRLLGLIVLAGLLMHLGLESRPAAAGAPATGAHRHEA